MTDQNRGAYAPQTDAPLAFDPRQPRGRGPAPFTLLVSAIVLMVLVVGALVIYRHGARTVGQAPMLVGAPVGDTKAAPPPGQDAAPSDQTAGLQVYKTEAAPANETSAPAAAAGPNFASAPEQPTPLPAARPMAPPPAVLTPPAQLRGPTQSPHAAPPPRAAPKPVIAQQTLPPPAATPAAPANDNNYLAGSAFGAHPAAPPHAPIPAAAKPASAPAKAAPVAHPTTTAQATPAASSAKPKPVVATPAPAAATSGGGTLVQIGAFSSDALATKGWSDAAHAVGGAMAGKTRKVEVATKDGQTFYRTFVGGFANHADAVAFCETLRAKGKSCFVK